MMFKKYFGTSVLSLLAATCVMLMGSCGSDSSDEPSKGPDAPVTPEPEPEQQSDLLGTWVNQAQEDMVYYLFFKTDGTGYFIKEGIQELNFSIFEKKDFKWTAIKTVDLATGASLASKGALGSVEINFTGGSSGTFSGDYQIGENGKMKLDEYSGFDGKTIFTKTSDLTTTAEIKGLWQGDYVDESSRLFTRTYSSFLRIDEDGKGYYNEYVKDYYAATATSPSEYKNFIGKLFDFSLYEVTGDILTLKDYIENTTTNTKELRNVANIRFKKNAVGGYNISSGSVERAIKKLTSAPASLSTTINNRIFWDGTDEEDEQNVFYVKDTQAIYLSKTNIPERTDEFLLKDTIVGKCSYKDYNICIDHSYVSNGKNHQRLSYVLVDKVGTSNYFGIYGANSSNVYKKYTSTNISTTLTGKWTLASVKAEDVKDYGEDVVVDNSITSEYNNLYNTIQFASNSQLLLKKNLADVDYLTCVYIATNGKVFFFSKKGEPSVAKQYEWEINGSTLLLKYKQFVPKWNSTLSRYVDTEEDHVIVYKK